ncbi:MAG: hypothetical protein ISR95_02940 [Candidatus Marinimicrobia bacterium]|nr:hypothetical protein [Candidatus Neomarinimicrobiota bacterium]
MNRKIHVLIVISFTLIWNCSTSFTLSVVDSEEKAPIADLAPVIIDENGEDILFNNMKTDEKGQLTFNLSEIPGDSFLVSIKDENYFPQEKWINPFSGKETKEIILNQRMTTVRGVVLDDSTFAGIPNCNVSTSPAIMKTTKTDSSGNFELKSKQFANISYVIIFDKPPEYESNSTNIKPILNEIVSFEIPIYLVRKKMELDLLELEGGGTGQPPPGVEPPAN